MRVIHKYKLQASSFRLQARRVLVACGLWLVALMMLSSLTGCNALKKKKRINKRVTLKRNDKIPYGGFVAYENLKYMFPRAEVEVNKYSPVSYNSLMSWYGEYSEDEPESDKKLYFILSPYFSPDAREYRRIMRFIGNGNHVFISASSWGREFSDSLNMDIDQFWVLGDTGDSLWVEANDPITRKQRSFTYPGSSQSGFFRKYDTASVNILGTDQRNRVNFIKIRYESGGSLYIHTAPLAFSNFFLLHKDNSAYYNIALSQVPANINMIYWDDYFRYGRKFSPLQVIMENPSLRAAFWIVLLIFFLIYVFDSKRKQRIIPKIAPLRNASLDFVKTIGRLYYQYRDNKNLGMKMTAHLLDHVRSRYHIPTSVMDERFVLNLAHKSGYDPGKLQKLVYHAKMIQEMPRVSDEDLLEFHTLTEDFYKHQ